MNRRRAALVAVAALGASFVLVPAAPATAAPAHRAGVVIDTGTEVKRVCIRFDAEEISGTEALTLAGAEPKFQEFGGSLGSFVCQLCGHPDPIGTCPSPSGDYWAYHRADGGVGPFTPSSLGASSTRVGDGDVEGWAWGRGGAPPFADLDTICGEVAVPPRTTAPASAAAPAPPRRPDPPATPRDGAVAAPPVTAPTVTSLAPTTTTAGPTGSTTTSRRRQDAPPDASDLAASDRSTGDEGGSPAALAGVGVLVAGLLGWSWHARRRRVGAVQGHGR